MASIHTARDMHRTIQFFASDRVRRIVRLGKVSLKDAKEICRRIEALNTAQIQNTSVDDETSRWLNGPNGDGADGVGDLLYKRLVAVGLVAPRQGDVNGPAAVESLGPFIDAFLAARTHLKPNTRSTFLQTRSSLVKFFGEDRPIDAVSPGDADEWAASLKAGYAPATQATYIRRARQLFRHATRKYKKLIPESPFQEVKIPSQSNKSREEFISLETTEKVIEAAPDAEWRLIIALARYGGLRTPSETFSLRWSDIHWDRDRFTVHNPKLAHLPGGGIRQVPLYPELRRYLEESLELAPDGVDDVIRRYRDPRANLRTQFLRIIAKAGVKPWGRLFQNLRSSRQTELSNRYPSHKVCAWMGNSERTADKHYHQMRDSDFESAAKSAAPALRNAVRAEGDTDGQERTEGAENPDISAEMCAFAAETDESGNILGRSRTCPSTFAGSCAIHHTPRIDRCPGGFEPATSTFTASHASRLHHGHSAPTRI